MFIFYTILLLAFFSPGLMIPGLANIWASDILLLLVFIWRVISPPKMPVEYRSYMQHKLMLPLYIFLTWLVLVTILTLSASPGVPIKLVLFSLVGRFRPIVFLLFTIPYCSDSIKIYKMFRFLIVLFALQCFVIFCQKYNISGINQWYTPRFRPTDVFVENMYLEGRRTIGSIGNPNSVGTFMSIFAILGYSVYVFGHGFRRWVGFATTIIAFIVCVFFAGTRQGSLSVILGCLLLSVVAMFLGKLSRMAFASILLLLSIPIFLFYLSQDYKLFERFAILTGGQGIAEVGSVQGRLALWPEFFGTYGAWIFTGKGMAGFISSITWDSGWLMIIIVGGLPLAFIYFWWLSRVSFECFKALPYRANAPALTGFLLAGPATTFIVIITNIVNTTFNDTKISILIGLVYVLSLGVVYHIQSSEYHPLDQGGVDSPDQLNMYGEG